jgi:hypothetical protein
MKRREEAEKKDGEGALIYLFFFFLFLAGNQNGPTTMGSTIETLLTTM